MLDGEIPEIGVAPALVHGDGHVFGVADIECGPALRDRAAEKYMEFLNNPALRIMGLLLAFRGFQYLFAPIQEIAERVLIGAG